MLEKQGHFVFLKFPHRYVVKDIVYTMKKAGQEVEPWLQEIAREANFGGGGGGFKGKGRY